MQSRGEVNRINYSDSGCSSGECPCVVSEISFSDDGSAPSYDCGSCNYNSWINNCAKISTNIFAPVSSPITIKYDADDAGYVSIDEVVCVDNLSTTATISGSCSTQLNQIKYYSFSGVWNNKQSSFHYKIKWNYPGTGFTNIPSSSVFLPSSLPGSPFTVEVVESICGDRIKTGPETCDDCNTLDGDGCSSSCYVEDGWTCTGGSPTTYDTCTEVCGDGKRFNYLNIYCDDGNPNDRDGCSFNCAIERGWYCFGGSTTSPDVCREICSNGIRFNSDPTYCDDGNLIDGDGCSSSCSVEYDFTCSGGSSNSQDFCKEICGDGVRVSTSKTYCDDGNTKSEDGCSSTCSIEVGYICSGGGLHEKDTCYSKYNQTSLENVAGVATKTAIGASIGASAGASLITMSSPIGIFSMINQFQLLLLLLVTGTFVSIGVFNMITGMKITMLNLNFINLEYFSIFKSIYGYLSIDQSNDNLSKIGIVTMLSIIVIHLLFLPIYIKCSNLPIGHKCRMWGFRIIELLAYTIYMRFMIQSFTTICLSSFNELYQFKISTQAEIVSFWINIFILLINYLFFLLCAWQVHRAYPKIKYGYFMYFTELFRGIKNKPQCLVYPIIFLSLRVLSCLLVIVFEWIDITLKIAILSAMHSAVAIYLLITKPFEEVKNSLFECMSQVVMAVFCIICIYYNTEDRWNNTVNWACIGIIVIVSLVNTIISFIELVKAIKLKIQKWLKKSKKHETKVKEFTTNEQKREEYRKEEHKRDEFKREELKREKNKSEENKIEDNKQNDEYKPYSKILLKNNKELYVQNFDFPIEDEEQESPSLPHQSTSVNEFSTSMISISSSKIEFSKRNESILIRSRLNGRRRFIRDIDI